MQKYHIKRQSSGSLEGCRFDPALSVSMCPRHLTLNCMAANHRECVFEWVNEKHQLYSAFDKSAI